MSLLVSELSFWLGEGGVGCSKRHWTLGGALSQEDDLPFLMPWLWDVSKGRPFFNCKDLFAFSSDDTFNAAFISRRGIIVKIKIVKLKGKIKLGFQQAS